MTEQTRFLCESMPRLAAVFQAADSRGSSEWELVEWKDKEPWEVGVTDMHGLGGRYPSRTPALIASRQKAEAEDRSASEKGHRGVWRLKRGPHTVYRTVLPLTRPRPEGDGSAPPPTLATPKSGSQSAVVRVSDATYRLLRKMASEGDNTMTMQEILDNAVREYDRVRFFEKANAAYEALQKDPEAWKEELEERAEWDGVLADGLDSDERWLPDRTAAVTQGGGRRSA